jgi:hypothetical protein
MKYTINGKEYSEFDINKRCAELMGIKPLAQFHNIDGKLMYIAEDDCIPYVRLSFDPCNNPKDTWPIIEKVWSKLNSFGKSSSMTQWERIIQQHNCTKLVAACICFIELA